jgi:hypothetical protein
MSPDRLLRPKLTTRQIPVNISLIETLIKSIGFLALKKSQYIRQNKTHFSQAKS